MNPKETQLLTIAAPFHTQYIMIMDMCRPHPFQVEVARINNVMHSTTTVRGHQKLVTSHKRPQGPHLAIPDNNTKSNPAV